MKRQSEDPGKQLSPPLKQVKQDGGQEDTTPSQPRNLEIELAIRRQMQLAAESADRQPQAGAPLSLASYQGASPHLVTRGSLYRNPLLTSPIMAPRAAAPISMPSLLGSLQMQQQQQLARQSQLPLTFASPAASADSLTQYILAAQLSRGLTGQPLLQQHEQQLNLLGIANSMRQTTTHSHPSYIDRFVYYGHAAQGAQGHEDSLVGGLTLSSSLPGSTGGNTRAFSLPATTASTSTSPEPLRSSTQASSSDCLPLSLTTDRSNLSDYQCLIREQIDLFAATQADIDSSAQGRNRPIVVQQVGIRCRHCASLPSSRRARGAVYYPAKLAGLYQAAQVSARTQCQRCVISTH